MLPLLGSAISILVGRSRLAQRVVGITVLATLVVVSAVLLVEVDRNGTIVTEAGGWAAPMGIALVADRFAAVLLLVAEITLFAVLVYAIGEPGAERNHVGFQSVYLVLAAGVAASFLTGDLFNLFVAFEVMLTASYVLLTLGGRRDQVRSGMTYIVISLIASTLFVTALALLYSATGTVNMAHLALRMGELPEGLRTTFAVLLLVVFGIKAAVFPLFFWLPDSYPTAPSPITAVFAGLLTKVGVYAIIRTQTLLFPEDSRPATLLLVIAAATMVVGVLGAIAQDDIRRILSFTIVSQIGYMVMGLGFFTLAGVAAVVYSIVHHIIVKTALFLVGGLVDHASGSSRLSRVGGMVRTTPVLALLFLLAALSLAGIPPLSGFVSKFALIAAGVEADQFAMVAVSLVVSFLTLFSMIRIWAGAFWSPAEGQDRVPATERLLPSGGGPLSHGRSDRRARRLQSGGRHRRRPDLRLQRAGGEGPPRTGQVHRGGPRTMRILVRLALLVALWLLAWGEVTLANLLSGVAVAGALLVAFPLGPPKGERLRVSIRGVARLALYVVARLVASNAEMTREILRRRSALRPGVLRHRLRHSSDEVVTLMTSIIALSPGTMTVDIGRDPPTIYVHFLLLHDVDAARASLAHLEDLVVAAIAGSPHDARPVDPTRTESP